MTVVLDNRLARETSPYLQQHKDNPVAWQPWDAQALAAARHADRPILLSIGYSACHWCHVMAHESFEDAAVAALLNRLFVNVKVDREERPDLDQIYQSAHQMLTGRGGGWPLTMFLAPDGTPFFGGTYFPPVARHGLPGFADLCERVAAAFRSHRGDVEHQNASLREALASTLPRCAADGPADPAPFARLRATLLKSLDRAWGGFGAAPKFPHATDLAFLLRQTDADARAAALLTLERMAAGGIHDQLGGGFCRYSVDERWEIPHFEKMLYDNAQLLALYAEAWRLTRQPLFEGVAAATAAWLMREMQAPAGGYYSSLDADSAGAEGRYYVWDRDEVRGLLDASEWRAVEHAWGLDLSPNFENRHWHLRLAAAIAPGDAAPAAAARVKLLAAREGRVRPGRDEKILTSWNALSIAAMLRAARLLDRPEWQASARHALDHVHGALWNGGRLLATSKDGRAHLDAYLDDHAFLLAALLEVLQTEFTAADLAWAVELADILLARFEDSESGGFHFTAHDHEPLIHRPKPAFDHATPSGNGVAAVALLRLGTLLGVPRYLDAARRTLALFASQLGQPGCATLLEAQAEAQDPSPQVILRGPPEEVRAWQRRLARLWGGFCLALPNGLDLPVALAREESPGVNAWVCSGVTCLAPVGDFDDLSRIILKSD